MNFSDADRRALCLPNPGYEVQETERTTCEDCGDALAPGAFERCGPCGTRRRAMYQAGMYAGLARNGQTVDESAVDSFRRFLPAALARKGFRLERESLAWVVRR